MGTARVLPVIKDLETKKITHYFELMRFVGSLSVKQAPPSTLFSALSSPP